MAENSLLVVLFCFVLRARGSFCQLSLEYPGTNLEVFVCPWIQLQYFLPQYFVLLVLLFKELPNMPNINMYNS